MRLFYRILLLESKKENVWLEMQDRLSASGIKYKTDIDDERFQQSHSSTMAGNEVLGRSVKPLRSNMNDQKTYKIYVKPKDKEKAEALINN